MKEWQNTDAVPASCCIAKSSEMSSVNHSDELSDVFFFQLFGKVDSIVCWIKVGVLLIMQSLHFYWNVFHCTGWRTSKFGAYFLTEVQSYVCHKFQLSFLFLVLWKNLWEFLGLKGQMYAVMLWNLFGPTIFTNRIGEDFLMIVKWQLSLLLFECLFVYSTLMFIIIVNFIIALIWRLLHITLVQCFDFLLLVFVCVILRSESEPQSLKNAYLYSLFIYKAVCVVSRVT